MLTDVFELFQNIYLEIYKLDPVRFFNAPRLVWEASLKKTKVRLDLLTDVDMLLMVKNGHRGGIYRGIYQYAKANSKYNKDYNKNKE